MTNECKVCEKKFSGYAELRDHVQSHGEAFRGRYGNPEVYKEYCRKRKKINGKIVPWHKIEEAKRQEEEMRAREEENEDLDLNEASISSSLFKEIIMADGNEGENGDNAAHEEDQAYEAAHILMAAAGAGVENSAESQSGETETEHLYLLGQ